MKRLRKLVPLVFVGVLLVLALLPAGAPANPPAATISFVGGGTLLSPLSVEVSVQRSREGPAISGPSARRGLLPARPLAAAGSITINLGVYAHLFERADRGGGGGAGDELRDDERKPRIMN